MPADSRTISLNQRHEVQYWKKELDVSEDDLRHVVGRVGHSVAVVRKAVAKLKYLRSAKAKTEGHEVAHSAPTPGAGELETKTTEPETAETATNESQTGPSAHGSGRFAGYRPRTQSRLEDET